MKDLSNQTTVLQRRAATTLYKAHNWQDGPRHAPVVILKVLNADRPGTEQLGQFLRELEVSELLEEGQVQGVRRCLGRTRHEGRHALVLDYIDGSELTALLPPRSLQELGFRLSLAASVARALAGLHRLGVIHRDIKPSNVLLSSSGETFVIDLGQASLIDVRTTQLGHPSRLDGTLLYMSPEQTGRMNRTVDYRSDLYSLGATLFHLLTGHPPFVSNDPLELVHSHLAKRPPSPSSLNPILPPVVSDLILRLLEKNPSDRYQSARGVENDLEAIIERLERSRDTSEVQLGRGDAPTRFSVVERLYGREEQEAALLAAFERVRAERVQLVYIGGPSGVGKSALVSQVYRPMTERRGSAARGKFDQLTRSVPYAAFCQAFTDLVALLLTHDDETLGMWRREILGAVGELGGVLLGLIPNLPLVTGPLPPVPPLEGTAAQNRLHWVARSFVRAVSHREHPLVLFIDDVQWADAASLDLLQALATDPEGKHLLLIVAYRDNEMAANHGFYAVLEAAAQAGVKPVPIVIDNLGWQDVAAMIADSTRSPREEAEALARVVHRKTRGNAFFVHQFLSMLADRGLLTFEERAGRWVFRREAVEAVEVTENVVDLLAGKIRSLDEGSQQVVQRAASLGNRFDLVMLSGITGQSVVDLHHALQPALAAGLLSPVDRGYLRVEAAAELAEDANATYAFAHDRVQLAAYTMLDEGQRRRVHLEAGRLLLRALRGEADARIFEVARHLNAAERLLEDPQERLAAADVELRAGRLAFTAGAYRQALEHAERGLALLPAGSWGAAYELRVGLELLASRGASLILDDARARRAAGEVLEHAKTGLEKASVYSDLALIAMTQEDLTGSVELGRKALAELGVRFPENPSTPHIILALLRVKLTLRGRIEELAEGKPLEDPRVEAALIIMDRLLPAAFRSGSKLFPLFVFEMVRLAAIHGLSCYSVAAFSSFAIAQCAVLKDYEVGYRFARTALKICERYPRGMGPAIFNIFVRHWKEPLGAAVEGFRQGARMSLELGDVYQATWCFCYGSLFLYVSGAPLRKVLESYRSHGDALLFDEGAEGMRKMITQLIHNLSSPTEQPHRLEGEDYNEAWVTRRFQERNDATEIGHYHNFSLQLCVLFGRDQEGLAHADALERYVDGLNPMYFWVMMQFLSGVVRARAGASSNDRRLLSKAGQNLRVLRRCAAQNPHNYAHMSSLVAALLADAQGKHRDARARYEQAIEQARRHAAPSADQALCLESFSRFLQRQADFTTASSLREQAAQEYLFWGATALHDRLSGQAPSASRVDLSTRTSRSVTSSSSDSALDLMSVMRASQAISGALVLEELLDQLLRAMIQNAGADRGVLVLRGGRPLLVEATGVNEKASISARPVEEHPELAGAILRYVERTQETVVIEDTSADHPFSSDPYLARSRAMSLLCVPILRQRRLVGVLYLENRLATATFTAARCEFLELLSVQAAISLENALLYDTLDSRVKEQTSQLRESVDKLQETQAALQAELSEAAEYVRSLLPEPILQGSIRATFRYVPSAHLGGDGLGYFSLDDGRFAFFVFDVAGHGIAAALLCIAILTALHSRRLQGVDFGDPASVLRALNAAFPLSTGGRHFTMWYGVLDPRSGHLACASAAHPSAILCDPAGNRREIGDPGIMLGVLPEVEFSTTVTILAPGERLYVFTDGAYEIELASGELLDFARFERELSLAAAEPDDVDRLLRFALTASKSGELSDDFSMLSVIFDPE